MKRKLTILGLLIVITDSGLGWFLTSGSSDDMSQSFSVSTGGKLVMPLLLWIYIFAVIGLLHYLKIPQKAKTLSGKQNFFLIFGWTFGFSLLFFASIAVFAVLYGWYHGFFN